MAQIGLRNIAFVILFLGSHAIAVEPPNEQFIYFHLHQAQGWAERLQNKKCPQSQGAIERHLNAVKYQQARLVDSVFYSDYLRLRDIAYLAKNLSRSLLERSREQMHERATSNKLKHNLSWQSEYLSCPKRKASNEQSSLSYGILRFLRCFSRSC